MRGQSPQATCCTVPDTITLLAFWPRSSADTGCNAQSRQAHRQEVDWKLPGAGGKGGWGDRGLGGRGAGGKGAWGGDHRWASGFFPEICKRRGHTTLTTLKATELYTLRAPGACGKASRWRDGSVSHRTGPTIPAEDRKH